jgi:hypothetical protein
MRHRRYILFIKTRSSAVFAGCGTRYKLIYECFMLMPGVVV